MAMKKRKTKVIRKQKPAAKRKALPRGPKRLTRVAKRPAAKRPAPTAKPERRARVTAASARGFISAAPLPQPRVRRGGELGVMTLAETGFQTAKDQAAVVGSQIVSFVSGVTAERRQAIADSSLLAQLVAKRRVPDPADVDAWYREYFDTLTQVGWVVQETNFAEYREASQNFEAHKAILAVATALMGAAPAGLALLKTTLEALQSMDADNPWITIFSRESQSARVARFQVSLAEQAPDGQFIVRTMAFALKAQSEITQVLFFKARSSEAQLRHYSGNVTINTGVLDSVAADLKAKLAAHARDFIRALPDL